MQEIDMKTIVPTFRKILLVGPEGTGKTRFIASMPRPIAVCSFDGGYMTLAGEDRIKTYVFMDTDRYRPRAWAEFKSFYADLRTGKLKYKNADGSEEPFKTIAIDSITALSKFILDEAHFVNNTIDAKAGGAGYTPYTRTKSFLEDVVVAAIHSDAYVVCTAIIETNKDELTQSITYLPSTEGKFREEAGQWFDVVGFMSVDINQATKKPVYTMDLVGDRMKKAKIRVPPSFELGGYLLQDPTFEKLTALVTQKKVAIDAAKTK